MHGVQSFIKGHRKSGVISIKHSRDMTNRISPLGAFPTCDCHIIIIYTLVANYNPIVSFQGNSHNPFTAGLKSFL